jgi:hypothetical protein
VLELVQRALRPVDDVLEVVEPDLHLLEVGPAELGRELRLERPGVVRPAERHRERQQHAGHGGVHARGVHEVPEQQAEDEEHRGPPPPERP